MRLKFSVILILSLNIIFSQAQFKKREMRAVWIATVANIDWPVSSRQNALQQMEDLRKMLDQLAENHINTVVFQARPCADAFYYSAFEPWSRYLTGLQGKRPNPYFDPLEFIIRESHKRFMKVHVWLNPYRMLNGDDINTISREHIFFKNNKLFKAYGGKYYFDPGYEETRNYLTNIVKDIVERYDLDAIHFDDYFYPYPVEAMEFPDNETFKQNPRGYSNISDWRRNNVNLIISEINEAINSIKPWVEFGISPFGVWRNSNSDPTGSDTRAGIQNYDDLYADIQKWLKEGTIDYVVPQLYWEIGKKAADYKILAEWWSKNSYNKNLYIGLYASGLEIKQEAPWKKPNELLRQIRLNQEYKEIGGVMFFSAKPFLKNIQGLNDSLKSTFFRYKAICPVSKNISGNTEAIQPENIRLLKESDNLILSWDPVEANGVQEVSYYIIYGFKGKKIGDLNDPASIIAFSTDHQIDLNKYLPKGHGSYSFVVTSINRINQESKPVFGITRRL